MQLPLSVCSHQFVVKCHFLPTGLPDWLHITSISLSQLETLNVFYRIKFIFHVLYYVHISKQV